MKTFIKNSIAVALAIAVIQDASGAQAIWTQYTSNQDKHANLPNCSYAGYHNGNDPLPSPTTNIINVKTAFGAKGDGVSDDTVAIRNAINSVGSSGGVVFFPDGTYVISGVIFIHKNNTILRGQSRAGTILKITKSLTTGYAANTNSSGQCRWSWAGGMIWFTPASKNTYLGTMPGTITTFNEQWNVGSAITSITSGQVRGDKTFTVSSASGLSAGQYVFVQVANATDLSTVKHLCGGDVWANNYDWSAANSASVLPSSKPLLNWPVKIASVSGNTVTLVQPLRFDLRLAWSPKLVAIGDTIRECGIETMTVKLMRNYGWSFSPNHNKEPGWNGPWFNNAIDCFVRGVTVVDPDAGGGTSASKNITFTDFALSWSGGVGTRLHHHGTTCRTFSQDCLFENFTINSEPYHGINVEDFSMGNVWSAGTMNFGTLDSHRALPYENIHTDININNSGNRGGAGDAGPVMGARFVNWNIGVLNNRNHMVGGAEEMPAGAIVGVRGCTINNPVHATFGDSKCVIDGSGATGIVPDPFNVFIAQRVHRLGGNMPPMIGISAPANGTTYASPANITINANASDTGGSISNVSFFSGTTSLGTDASSPYGVVWNNVNGGVYSLTARATDNGGAVSASTPVAVTVNYTGAKTVMSQINSGGPAAGSYVADTNFTGGQTSVTTNQINTSGVTNPAPAAVYQSERFGNLGYTFSGLTARSTYIVRLHFAETFWPQAGKRKFHVVINGVQVLSNLDIFAAAGGANKAIVYEFTTSADGNGQVIVMCLTSADQAKISGIELYRPAGSGNSSPTVAITSPGNGATYTAPASITINANANDSDGSINNVQFLAGTTSLGTDTSSPYGITWNSVAAGAYSLTARATDNGGAATTSAAVNVTVNGTTGGGTVLHRINAGGAAVSPFSADANFSGGTAASTTATINVTGVTNPAPAAVYQTERYGNCTYTFGSLTANTSHTVRLHFAETWHSAAGLRKFDVSINGTQVLNDYDVYAAAGAKNKAVITQHTVNANASGQIVIQFTNVVENAKINGIEIIKN